MYAKKIPRELVDATTGNSYILVDGDFFIWTSTNMMIIFCKYKMSYNNEFQWKILDMKNEKDKDEDCKRLKMKTMGITEED